MINLKRILMPTDFSELAAHALRYACDLARAYRAELHVLHVVSPSQDLPVAADGGAGMASIGGGVVLMESLHDAVARKSKELQTHIDAFSHDRLPAAPTGAVRTGVPWEEIVRYADEAAIDLIVIGSHARGVMKRIFLGSTSKAVLEHVARPVLMVPIAALKYDAGAGSGGPDAATGT